MKRQLIKLMIIAVLLWFCSPEIMADIFHVPSQYPDIQSAIASAAAGDRIVVADGTYTGSGNRNINFQGKAITVISTGGPDVCVIDCEMLGVGFIFSNFEDSTSILEGFTIQNGVFNGDPGGGLLVFYHASPIVENCRFINGYADGGNGGAAFVDNGAPVFIDCRFLGNSSSNEGGAVWIFGGSAIMDRCLFNGNSAGSVAGAVGVQYGSITLANCRITGNDAGSYGGGVYLGFQAQESTLTNCQITANSALDGAGLYIGNNSSDTDISFATIADNLTGGSTGGVYDSGSQTTIIHTIIYGNQASQITGLPAVTNSDIQGGFSGTGNIDLDPLFISGTENDYFLSNTGAGQPVTSPCVNAGAVLSGDACFTAAGKSYCMDRMSTRTDLVIDQNNVDLGYHEVMTPEFMVPAMGYSAVFILLALMSGMLVMKISR